MLVFCSVSQGGQVRQLGAPPAFGVLGTLRNLKTLGAQGLAFLGRTSLFPRILFVAPPPSVFGSWVPAVRWLQGTAWLQLGRVPSIGQSFFNQGSLRNRVSSIGQGEPSQMCHFGTSSVGIFLQGTFSQKPTVSHTQSIFCKHCQSLRGQCLCKQRLRFSGIFPWGVSFLSKWLS